MSTAREVEPTVALATIVQTLEPSKAAIVREAFSAMFHQVESWQEEAAGLVVTAEDQKHKMKRANLLRLEVKASRVALEKKRKAMKEGILLEGRAIDGAFAIFEALTKPIESHLLEQEQFAERAEAGRRDALRSARVEALLALDVSAAAMSPALGDMSEEAWSTILEDAKSARDARAERARIAEEARVEAARIVAEKEAARKTEAARVEAERRVRAEAQRIENERLKADRDEQIAGHRAEMARRDAERAIEEATRREEREAEAKAAKVAADELARVQTEERNRRLLAESNARAAQREADELRQKEATRVAAEAETKKPTKAKYSAMLAALRSIASAKMPYWCAEDFDDSPPFADNGNFDDAAEMGQRQGEWYAAEIALECLRSIGESP